MSKEIEIVLEYIRTPEIIGEGDDLTLSIEGQRTNKLGNVERYLIKASMGRWNVQRLARQIATMHERDRERLARELSRIERECEAVAGDCGEGDQ